MPFLPMLFRVSAHCRFLLLCFADIQNQRRQTRTRSCVVARGVSFESADGTVGFACFSFGIAPAGFYTGFYHSPDGAPKAFQNAKIELRPDGESWRYDEPGGDNRYVTRRIKGNWYYYRMSF